MLPLVAAAVVVVVLLLSLYLLSFHSDLLEEVQEGWFAVGFGAHASADDDDYDGGDGLDDEDYVGEDYEGEDGDECAVEVWKWLLLEVLYGVVAAAAVAAVGGILD